MRATMTGIDRMRVAAVQAMAVPGEVEANVATAAHLVERSAHAGAGGRRVP